MTNPTVKIHNVETGEIVEREMNADELMQWQTDQAETLARREAQAAKAAEKAAVLAKLGLSADEVAALLS